MARVGAQAEAGVELEDVLVAPIQSIPKALRKAGLSLDDIDLFEVNEAFAATTIAVMKTLGIDRQGERTRRRSGARTPDRGERREGLHHVALRTEGEARQEGYGIPLFRRAKP